MKNNERVPEKWCFYCRTETHEDSECNRTRPEGWKPEPRLDGPCCRDVDSDGLPRTLRCSPGCWRRIDATKRNSK